MDRSLASQAESDPKRRVSVRFRASPCLLTGAALHSPSVTERSTMSKPTDLVQGTLDLLILKTIALEPMHGWAIAQRIRQVSKEVLQVNQGALYPALHRLEQQGWIAAQWGESENNRRAKYYSLTKSGKKYLQSEQANWERLSAAIGLVLKTA